MEAGIFDLSGAESRRNGLLGPPQIAVEGPDGRGSGERVGPAILRLGDGENIALEVYVTPAQPEQLAPAKAGL